MSEVEYRHFVRSENWLIITFIKDRHFAYALCRSLRIVKNKTPKNQQHFQLQRGETEPKTYYEESKGKIIIYQRIFEEMLAAPKDGRDQLILDLPILQAFRTGEVSSFRAEWANFDDGTLWVLDSKKGTMFLEPMRTIVAKHLDAYMQETGIYHGLLILAYPWAHRKSIHKLGAKTRGEGLSESQINRRWIYWSRQFGAQSMTARWGRAYFACNWHFTQHKSMKGLQTIMRHDDIQSTDHYLNRIISFEDVAHEFHEGVDMPKPVPLGACASLDSCVGAECGCHCRLFRQAVPIEAKT